MGLEIYAVSHLRYLRPIPPAEERERLYKQFADEGKESSEIYFYLSPNDRSHKARLGGMKPGMYEYTERTERHSFRAGSYSGYNWW